MKDKNPASERQLSALADYDDDVSDSSWRWGWVVMFLVACSLLGAAAYGALGRRLAGVELSVFHVINGWPDALRPFFLAATVVPESLWIGVAAVVSAFVLRAYRLAWQLAAATIAGYASVFVGKAVIGRARPEGLVHDIHVRVHETGMGFPSGHTMIITVIVLTLWPYLSRGWRWLAVLLIPLMGLSRIYLGVHSPLDIVGGFAVGALVVALMRAIPAGLRRFFRFD